MRRSTTAVLLSAFVLPGAGQLYLKHYWRGIALMAVSLACLWIIVNEVMQQASLVLDRLGAEGGAIDAGQISGLLTQASSTSESTGATMATLVLGGCWLVGIVDAYLLARRK